jgi:phenylacetate-coenzyme A ligase PaaK-like adenylate-forming protein
MQQLDLSWEQVVDFPDTIPPLQAEDLRAHSIESLLSKPLLEKRPYLITSETSGFSGQPVMTCFTESEFTEGFVTPFVRQAENVGFPLRGNWLWAGPTGPHIVGKALREILRTTGGTDAFSVDFDPRWYKKQAKGSLSARRYFQHVLDQIEDIFARQTIDILYSTPPVIMSLAESLEREQREHIQGVHYAGMAMDTEQYTYIQQRFPNALHMSGYGNSLLGMFPETGRSDAGIEYKTQSERLEVRVIQENADGTYSDCEIGSEGRVMVSRFDESALLLNLLLEDVAIRTPDGICNPHRPLHQFEGKLLY